MKNKWLRLLPLIYLLFGILWVTLTDYWLYSLRQNNNLVMAEYVNLLKGWVFIIITAVLIYLIIKKHEALKQLEQKEHELLTLINNMPDFVCFKDGEGRWLLANEYGLSLYELQNVDYKGKTDLDLGEYSPHFKEAFAYCTDTDERTWQEGKITRDEESFAIPCGELKTFDVIKVPLFYPDGKRRALVTIGRDISSLKKAEQLLVNKEKMSVVGELSAGIAHEIKNPLTAIKGFIQLIQKSGKTNKDHVNLVLSEIDRINDIVSEMLILSKPHTKKLVIFPLKDAIQYVIDLVSNESLKNNIHIHLNNIDESTLVKGDINGLKQVFLNLIKNAMEAMPTGGVIDISSLYTSEDYITIKIRDNGIGISVENQKLLGHAFFTSKEKGMGLGLTITYKIIQEHNGHISIESKEGEGTVVTLSLPTS
ncbi:ATP-binding protein [Bacillus haimaensis]|uniref:ATP-binding protein n=1 Tax=Bacillus haimaensis TaxID=3160967 RepID=UPI003AA8BE10